MALNPKPLTPPQQDLFAEDQAADEADLQQQLEHVGDLAPKHPQAKRPRAGRQALPAHLTRIDVKYWSLPLYLW
ncbi:MAG: transposase [Moraxellaceae bacterium]|nr:transposase [Moraxellaceae bacterium]